MAKIMTKGDGLRQVSLSRQRLVIVRAVCATSSVCVSLVR